jgi:hypothetical protein
MFPSLKVIADMGVELRQIYSLGRRSHHPNNALKINLTLTTLPKRRNEVLLPPATTAGAASGERGTKTNVLTRPGPTP